MVRKILKANSLLKSRDFWVVVLVIVLGLYTGFFRDLFVSSNKSGMAYLEIDFGDKKRAFEGEILGEMSILDAVLAASRGGDFEIRYAILRDTTDVMKINGLTEDGLNEKSWNFYLNGRKIETGEVHKIQIKAGDKVLVVFE